MEKMLQELLASLGEIIVTFVKVVPCCLPVHRELLGEYV